MEVPPPQKEQTLEEALSDELGKAYPHLCGLQDGQGSSPAFHDLQKDCAEMGLPEGLQEMPVKHMDGGEVLGVMEPHKEDKEGAVEHTDGGLDEAFARGTSFSSPLPKKEMPVEPADGGFASGEGSGEMEPRNGTQGSSGAFHALQKINEDSAVMGPHEESELQEMPVEPADGGFANGEGSGEMEPRNGTQAAENMELGSVADQGSSGALQKAANEDSAVIRPREESELQEMPVEPADGDFANGEAAGDEVKEIKTEAFGAGASSASKAAGDEVKEIKTEDSLSEMQKVMYIVVKFKYFDEIYKGVKGVEFRADTERWQKILTGKTHIVFVRGMTAMKTTKRRILSIEIVSPDEAVQMGCPEGQNSELFGGAEKLLAIQFEQFREDLPAEEPPVPPPEMAPPQDSHGNSKDLEENASDADVQDEEEEEEDRDASGDNSVPYLGRTEQGEEFAVRWPSAFKRIPPTSDNVQSLKDAFGWPAKVKEKLPDVVASMQKSGHIPVISTGLCLRVASFFSGICSQSRGAQILQNHGFGVSFSHIAFTEKSKQCHSVLKEDFPDSCIFKDQMHYLTPKCREQVASAKNCEAVVACLREASFVRRAACLTHDDCCRLPCMSLDLAVFGAPCVDDSPAGKSLKEEGPARRVTLTCLEYLKTVAKPKMALGENVSTGNINQNCVEVLQDTMSSKAIYTQPSDLGFGAVSRRRVFTAFVRRDCGRFIGDPQQIYNILTASLRDRQLSIEKLTELTSDLEVEADRKVLKRNCDPNFFLTKCEAANKARYEALYDEKHTTTLADQCFVLNQNPDKRPKQSKDGVLPLFTKTDRITWLRQRGRHLTALEKLLGHGWPMRQELACLLNLPVFDASRLSTPHAAVGNGQHVPCATVALLATLCCIELYAEVNVPSTIDGDTYVILNVMADGRCFWTCCYLWQKGIAEQNEWLDVARNATGMPLATARMKQEENLVSKWFNNLVAVCAEAKHDDPEFQNNVSRIHAKFQSYEIPEDDDIRFFLGVIGAKLVLVGKSFSVLLTLGCEAHPPMLLSNTPSKDGDGNAVAHFRLFCKVPSNPGLSLEEVAMDFPELEVAKDGVTMNKYGLTKVMKVPKDSKTLARAALLLQTQLEAADRFVATLTSLDKKQLEQECGARKVCRKGSRDTVLQRLVQNYLETATGRELCGLVLDQNALQAKFPKLTVLKDSVKVDVDGFSCELRVPQDATSLEEAAVRLDDYNRTHQEVMEQVSKLNRQTLRDRCKESGLTVRGNVDELKKKIVHHALSQLPWHKASGGASSSGKLTVKDAAPETKAPGDAPSEVPVQTQAPGDTHAEVPEKETGAKAAGQAHAEVPEKETGAKAAGQAHAEVPEKETGTKAADSAEVPMKELQVLDPAHVPPDDMNDPKKVQMAFPKVKVNKKTCSVKIGGMSQSFAIPPAGQLFEVVRIVNEFFEAGEEERKTLNVQTKSSLKEKAESNSVAKYGNIEDLRQRLLGFWISRTSKKVEEQLASFVPSTAGLAEPEGGAPSQPPLKSVEPNDAANGAGLPEEPGSSTDPANLTLFGRSTFALKPEDCADRTDFFANIDNGPEVKADQKEGYIELFETGFCMVFCLWQPL